MMHDRQLARRLRRYGNGLAAAVASALVLVLLGASHGTRPALGPALVPGHGVWTSPSGQLPAGGHTEESLRLTQMDLDRRTGSWRLRP